MGSFASDLERIRAKYATPMPKTVPSTSVHDVDRALVMETDSGRTVVTAPVREVASANEGFMYIHGRFVEADKPNSNGAYWTTADLEMGEPTVAGGPLNWLHQERKIIGSLLTGRLVHPQTETASDEAVVGNHIESTAAVWRFLYPKEALTIEKAAADHQLFYSMECVSREVECRHEACGETVPYATYIRDKASLCDHLRERSDVMRFKEPIFLGGAIIVPPVRPGWANADVDIVKQAAAAAEQNNLDLGQKQAAALAEQILLWAGRE
jgi:hypothetical protein